MHTTIFPQAVAKFQHVGYEYLYHAPHLELTSELLGAAQVIKSKNQESVI
jgi:hypothetical protein